jgi:hypothetical protein
MNAGHRMRNLVLAVLLFPNLATAAVIEQALMSGQPQMSMKDGRANMCGLRVVALPTTFRDENSPEMFYLDTSLVMGRTGTVVIKGFGARATQDELAKGKVRKLRLSSLWFKPDGSRATRPQEGTTSSGDDGISLLYADQEPYRVYVSFLNSIAKGLNVTIGFRLAPNDDERIVTGVVTLNESDMASFGKCNVEIAEP